MGMTTTMPIAVKERRAELLRIMDEAGAELATIQDDEQEREAKALVGRAFRYWTSYSLPQSDGEYWWAYRFVIDHDGGRYLEVLDFQTDKDFKREVERHRVGAFHVSASPKLGWFEIPVSELAVEWRQFVERIEDMGIPLDGAQ